MIKLIDIYFTFRVIIGVIIHVYRETAHDGTAGRSRFSVALCRLFNLSCKKGLIIL